MNILTQFRKLKFSLVFGVLFFCFFHSSCIHSKKVKADSTNNKGTLFIIGGGDRPVSLINSMIDRSGLSEKGYAVVLPMASSIPDTAGYYGKLQFMEKDVEATAFKFGSHDEITAVRLDSLRNAALIYITGGAQSRFMGVVENHPAIKQAIEEAYQAGAVIAGTSAGAAVMSRVMITGDQKNHPEYTSTFYHLEKDNLITDEGLGLITRVIIDQHFVSRARNNRLLTAVMEHPEKVGIGIDESTAIVVKGNEVTVVGESQVLVYRNTSGSVTVKDGKLGARNISVSIYLPGDHFLLSN